MKRVPPVKMFRGNTDSKQLLAAVASAAGAAGEILVAVSALPWTRSRLNMMNMSKGNLIIVL